MQVVDLLMIDKLWNTILIGITFSIIMMSVIQKVKALSFIKTDNQIWVCNLILSFGIGIPFSMFFYELSIYDGLWVSLLSFIGAPGIYKTMKKQNIINYTPKSLDDKKDVLKVPKENYIDRRDIT